eukprot:1461786-Pleurochrysis_carterae.AAC.2
MLVAVQCAPLLVQSLGSVDCTGAERQMLPSVSIASRFSYDRRYTRLCVAGVVDSSLALGLRKLDDSWTDPLKVSPARRDCSRGPFDACALCGTAPLQVLEFRLYPRPSSEA